jgi:hypothetical protein
MLFLMLAAVLFALFVGALAFVTGPVGGVMAAVIALWLAVYAARGVRRRVRVSRSASQEGGEGSGSDSLVAGSTPRRSTGGSAASRLTRRSAEAPTTTARPTPRHNSEAAHHA